MSSVQRVTRAPAMKQPLFGREMHTFIAATPEVVFRYVTDIRRHTEWSAEPLEIKLDPGPEHGPGMTFTSIAAVGRNRIIGHGRVIAEEQPTRFVYECTDLFGCHRWTLTLEPEGNGTRLTQRMERLEGPLWVRLLQPSLMWPLVGRRSVGKGLARIKTRLEAGEACTLANL